MALFGKDRDRKDGLVDVGTRLGIPPALPTHEAAPREVVTMNEQRDNGQLGGPGGVNAFLGKGSQVTGKLVFEGMGRIEGQVEGEISAQETLTIGESAVVNAQITGTTIIIQGRVTGDITAKQRLELRAPSRVHGNISTPSLVVQDGAFFEGQCNMRGSELATLGEKSNGSVLLQTERRTDGVSTKASAESRPAVGVGSR